MSAGLALEAFGVAFGDQLILSDLDLELPSRGLTVVVGPAGCGKSTLVRTIAGLNDCHPSLATWGTVTLDGAPLTADTRPTLVTQHARFFLDSVRENLVSALPNRSSLEHRDQTRIVTARLEAAGLGELCEQLPRNAVDLPLSLQRRLAIVRALIREPRVIFADEPTAGLDDHAAAAVIAMLRLQANERSVLLVTHHQRFAVAAGGTTVLIAGGRIQETAPTGEFFACPRTEIARQFVRTGGCVTPAIGVPIQAPDTPPPTPDTPEPPREPRSRFVGPRGFFWVTPGRLGGMPRPGIIDDLSRDLDGLRRLGVTILVTLEETLTVDVAAVTAAGIRPIHVPIVDMGVPEVTSAIALCAQLAVALASGEVIAVHCRAGMGRTGTLLACQLIAAGQTPRDALDAVRSINPRCVQSDAQVDFLRLFATALGGTAAAPGEAGRAVDDGQQSRTRKRTGDTTWH